MLEAGRWQLLPAIPGRVENMSDSAGECLLRLLSRPLLYTDASWLPESAWHQHIPFAFLAVDLLRPRQLVELGTQKGASYCAFCEAAVILKHDMQSAAVDHWHGDQHSGSYDSNTYDVLRAHHDPRYGSFSKLMRMNFDDARSHFPDGSIDLLHIDGFHTYEAVRHDFETWLPKLSDRGVVLMHDTEVRDREFGVWRLWEELTGRYPSFSVAFGYGLGVLMVGAQVPAEFRALSALSGEARDTFAGALHALGQRFEYRHERDVLSVQRDDFVKREKYLYETYLGYKNSAEEARKVREGQLEEALQQVAHLQGLIKEQQEAHGKTSAGT
jgi:hypothetical protein